jgi:hypothetical protein
MCRADKSRDGSLEKSVHRRGKVLAGDLRVEPRKSVGADLEGRICFQVRIKLFPSEKYKIYISVCVCVCVCVCVVCDTESKLINIKKHETCNFDL